MGIWNLEMQVGRYFFVLKRQDDLYYTGDSGCSLKMSDVGFNRSDHKEIFGCPSFAERSGKSVHFDWIAK